MVRSLRVSLQAKLLAVILLCALVPVLAIGAYLMRLNEKTLGEKVSETLDSHLLRKGVELDLWMGERLKEAARWSASFVVYEGLQSLSGPAASPRAQRDLVEYLESLLGHYRVYESLFIVDPQGKVVAATRDERLEEWMLALLPANSTNTATIVSPVRSSTFLGRPTMVILQPVAPGLEGRGPDPGGQRSLSRVGRRVGLRARRQGRSHGGDSGTRADDLRIQAQRRHQAQ